MTYRIEAPLLAAAGSMIIAASAFAADPVPVVALTVVEPEPRCNTVGYEDAYFGAGTGRVFDVASPAEGVRWIDLSYGGAGRAAIQCTPAFSIQLDA